MVSQKDQTEALLRLVKAVRCYGSHHELSLGIGAWATIGTISCIVFVLFLRGALKGYRPATRNQVFNTLMRRGGFALFYLLALLYFLATGHVGSHSSGVWECESPRSYWLVMSAIHLCFLYLAALTAAAYARLRRPVTDRKDLV
jgi:hypothetical protein